MTCVWKFDGDWNEDRDDDRDDNRASSFCSSSELKLFYLKKKLVQSTF